MSANAPARSGAVVFETIEFNKHYERCAWEKLKDNCVGKVILVFAKFLGLYTDKPEGGDYLINNLIEDHRIQQFANIKALPELSTAAQTNAQANLSGLIRPQEDQPSSEREPLPGYSDQPLKKTDLDSTASSDWSNEEEDVKDDARQATPAPHRHLSQLVDDAAASEGEETPTAFHCALGDDDARTPANQKPGYGDDDDFATPANGESLVENETLALPDQTPFGAISTPTAAAPGSPTTEGSPALAEEATDASSNLTPMDLSAAFEKVAKE